MKTKKISGLHIEKMLRNALANLSLYEKELNELNVFPVADGDTGANMYATLESGIRAGKSNQAAGAYLKSVTDAMLFGARGNSGVILSQLFRGIFTALSHCGVVNPREMRNAFIAGYKTAYSAVVRPVEGTILTVAREGIEHIRTQIDRGSTFEQLLSLYVAEMRKSLSHTPEMLPELKEANVIDSGALGYIVIVEGMLKYLYGEIIDGAAQEADQAGVEHIGAESPALDLSLFDENTLFESGYCMEFILQLMTSSKYSQHFSLNRYIDGLEDYGSSLVAVQDGKRVKVHIHTFKPGKIFAYSQEFGEFLTCKVENMQLQHNMVAARKKPNSDRIPFAVIAVADCEPMRQVLLELGCTYVLSGGTKMNVSVQDMVNAIKSVNADRVVLLPNNSNLIRAANQAKNMDCGCEVVLLETHTIPQGYCAVQMDIADSKDYDYRLRQMKLGMDSVETLSVTDASKDYSGGGVSCRAGTPIAVSGSRVLSAGEDPAEVFCDGLEILLRERDSETCVIFRGETEPEESEAELERRLQKRFPLLEAVFLYGGSRLYRWNAALM